MNETIAGNARFEKAPPGLESKDEVLVTDSRSGLSPAQMVDRRLITLLRGAPLPVSTQQTVNLPRLLS